MNSKKKILIISITTTIILLGLMTLILVLCGKHYSGRGAYYYNYLVVLAFITMVLPLAALILQAFFEAKIKDFSSPDYFSFTMFIIIIAGVLIYLATVNVVTGDRFNKYSILLWILLGLDIVGSTIFGIIFEKKKPKNNHNIVAK